MGKNSIIVAAALATSVFAAQAHAGSVTLIYDGESPKTSNLSVSFTSGSTTKSYTNLPIGEFTWTVGGPTTNPVETAPVLNPGDPGYGGTSLSVGALVNTFCIEGTQTIANPTPFTITSNVAGAPMPGSGMGAERAAFLTEFWGKNFPLLAGLTGTTANTYAAAFQLGVWAIVYNSPTANPGNPAIDDSFFHGATPSLDASVSSVFTNSADNFKITGDSTGSVSTDAAVQEALNMLRNVTGTYTATTFELGALENGSDQDQIGAFNPSGPPVGSSVPLPAALPVGGAMLGMMGLIAGVRRKRQA